ncbi:MAG: hypothetical protein LBR60_07515 [Fibrobacter sp.]|jgi:hypothetical protein|nr:hypothetical protein [Fibrobacter sp.]
MNTGKKGAVFIEILVGFAILGTVGVLLLGFLHRNPMSQKAYVENSGRELTKRTLLLMPHFIDTVYSHQDVLGGAPWQTIVTVSREGEEICAKAFSVRMERDTTRSLTYCKFGVQK